LPPALAIIIVLFIVAADQLSKYYISSNMSLGQSIPLIDGIFHFTYVLNPGAAFGILENQTTIFIIAALLVLGGSIYFFAYAKEEHRFMRIGIILIAGGAAGNLIDRIKTGLVIDFFDFRIWPVFNIADIAIVSGAGLIVLVVLFLQPDLKRGDESESVHN
jgi:signal peptidase II